MKKNALGILLLTVLVFSGCAAVDRAFNTVAPNQKQTITTTNADTGVQTNTIVDIPGTHALTPQATAVITDTAPLTGPVAPFVMPFISLILLGVNFFQKTKNGQLSSAITSTVQTIENAGNDPSLAPAIVILKNKLASSHQIAGIQPVINNVLADLKMLPTLPVVQK